MSASTTSDTHSVSSGVSHNSSTASGAPPVVQNPFEAVLPNVSNDPFAAVVMPLPPSQFAPPVSSSMQSPMKMPLPATTALHPSPSGPSFATTLPPTSPSPSFHRSTPLDVRSPPAPNALTNIAPSASIGDGAINTADLLFDDDENTAPSSLGNATDNDTQQSSEPMSRFTSRFIESTKRFMSNNSINAPLLRKDSDEPVLLMAGGESRSTTLIAGYLQKLGRNGKWQTRWFETNGEFLSYYKSAKRSKLLATLDLQKVGLIEIDSDDKTEHSFRIQVLGRLYHLRANSRASCHDWVITLNRVKEARMQQGNVKLVGLPTSTTAASLATSALDLLQNGGKGSNPTATAVSRPDGTPRVVVVSNRERTRAVDEEEQWDQLIRVDPHTLEMDIDPVTGDSTYAHNKRLSSFSTVVAARWTKHQSSLQRVGTKVSKWARSVKKYSCTTADGTSEAQTHSSSYGGGGVQLDKYLHPPGHDDKKMSKPKVVVPSHHSVKPDPVKDRTLSTASDYDSRMLS